MNYLLISNRLEQTLKDVERNQAATVATWNKLCMRTRLGVGTTLALTSGVYMAMAIALRNNIVTLIIAAVFATLVITGLKLIKSGDKSRAELTALGETLIVGTKLAVQNYRDAHDGTRPGQLCSRCKGHGLEPVVFPFETCASCGGTGWQDKEE